MDELQLLFNGENFGFGYTNDLGEHVLTIPCIYENAYGFSGDLARVQLNGKWGFINREGKIVIPCLFNNVSNFDFTFALVRGESASLLIDRDLNYYDRDEEKINCKDCRCFNDKLMTGYCCLLSKGYIKAKFTVTRNGAII